MGDIDEVEVIEVAAQPGTSVNPGDLLVVLESDKASMEIPIEVSGMLLEISVAVGDQVSAGSLLATARVEIQQAPVAQTAAQPEPARQLVHAAEPLQNAEPTQVASTSLPQRTDSDATVYAGPATARLAREIGVPLAQVLGSGNRGRITKDDVKAWAKARLNLNRQIRQVPLGRLACAAPQAGLRKIFGPVEEEPLSRIQKQVAANMHRSWVNILHVTQHAQANIDDLEQFRLARNEARPAA